MNDMGVEWFELYSKVRDASRGIAWTRWFIDGRVNVAHNCVDRHAVDPNKSDLPALIHIPETGDSRSLSYGELHRDINRCANAMKARGIGPGDCVGVYAPMRPETITHNRR